MNEVESKESIHHLQKLKEKTDNEILNVKERFVSNTFTADLNQMFIFSNFNCPVCISATDRRYVVYMTNSDLYKNVHYWTECYKTLCDPSKMDVLFTWLYQLDIEGFKFRDNRPITASFKRLASRSVPDPIILLKYHLDRHLKFEGNSEWRYDKKSFCDFVKRLAIEVFSKKEYMKPADVRMCLDKLELRYIEIKATKLHGQSRPTIIVPDPKKLLDRLKRIELEHFDSEDFDWEQIKGLYQQDEYTIEEDD
jgi:hypothetical protein